MKDKLQALQEEMERRHFPFDEKAITFLKYFKYYLPDINEAIENEIKGAWLKTSNDSLIRIEQLLPMYQNDHDQMETPWCFDCPCWVTNKTYVENTSNCSLVDLIYGRHPIWEFHLQRSYTQGFPNLRQAVFHVLGF